MNDILRELKANELNNKRVWLDLIKFYNDRLESLEYTHSMYYRLKRDAVDKVLQCDIQIQYLEFELKNDD